MRSYEIKESIYKWETMKTTSKGHRRSQSHKGAGSLSCGLLSVVTKYFRSSNKVRGMGDSDVAALVGQPALLQLVNKVIILIIIWGFRYFAGALRLNILLNKGGKKKENQVCFYLSLLLN